MNRTLLLACNFNCLINTEGLLKVTASQVHCKCDNISEMVQHRDGRRYYRPMVSSDIYGLSYSGNVDDLE